MNERVEGCPLCGICEREPENVLYEDEHFAIIRTANLKGHRERVMLILKRHVSDIPPNISYDFSWVTNTPVIRQRLKEIFGYTYKAIIMEGKYGSYPDHWHLCITDLETDSEDHQQILGTPWLEIIDIKEWK